MCSPLVIWHCIDVCYKVHYTGYTHYYLVHTYIPQHCVSIAKVFIEVQLTWDIDDLQCIYVHVCVYIHVCLCEYIQVCEALLCA